MDELQPYILATLKAQAAAREQAVEQAVQTGVCGVLETVHPDMSVSFQVAPSVPYGYIHVQHERG